MIPLTVRDAMTSPVLAVRRNTSLAAARRLFARHHVAGAPVVDAHGLPIGMVTQSDLIDPDWKTTRRAGTHLYFTVSDGEISDVGVIPDNDDDTRGLVEDIMSPYIMTVHPTASLMDAVRHLLLGDVHRLLVTDDDRLVGILTTVDILRALAALEDKTATTGEQTAP